MDFVIEFGKVGLFDVQKSIGSSWWFLQVNDDLILKNGLSVDVETIPLFVISAVTPVMTTNSITSVHKNVH